MTMTPTVPAGNPQCARYTVTGVKCGNHTANPDGWCRAPGCDGYRTAQVRPVHSLRPRRNPRGASPWVPCAEMGLTPQHAEQIAVTRSALRQFVEQHGGSFEHAEAELRLMVDDFTRVGNARRTGTGYWYVFVEGFLLVLSDDLAAVTGYGCAHAERSYAQVAARVPSRVSKRVDGQQNRKPRELRAAERPEPEDPEAVWDALADLI